MARWGRCDFKELKQLEQRLEQLERADWDNACRQTAKKLAAMLLNKVKKRTPVGVVPDGLDDEALQHWSGYTGGTLRDAWQILPLEKQGDQYIITILNPTEYASYVEYGHRQRPGRYVPALGKSLKATWVDGRYMLTISIQEVQAKAPAMLERALYQCLKEVF